MNRSVGKCLVCNRLFQATDKNRWRLTRGGVTKAVEICDYHVDSIQREIDLATEIVEAQVKKP